MSHLAKVLPKKYGLFFQGFYIRSLIFCSITIRFLVVFESYLIRALRQSTGAFAALTLFELFLVLLALYVSLYESFSIIWNPVNHDQSVD